MKTNKLLVCLWEISHGNIDNIKPQNSWSNQTELMRNFLTCLGNISMVHAEEDIIIICYKR